VTLNREKEILEALDELIEKSRKLEQQHRELIKESERLAHELQEIRSRRLTDSPENLSSRFIN